MDFNYELQIFADVKEVFACLTNPFQIEIWSGCHADMQAIPNYEFSLWDGDITGINIRINANKRIEQEWYFGDQEEKSIVVLTLHKEIHSTTVELNHTNIPDDVYDEICEGWKEYYLGSIKNMLEFY